MLSKGKESSPKFENQDVLVNMVSATAALSDFPGGNLSAIEGIVQKEDDSIDKKLIADTIESVVKQADGIVEKWAIDQAASMHSLLSFIL